MVANSAAASGFQKKKMTKEERRAKYTAIARKRRDKEFERKRSRHLICYHCRKPGHSVAYCPLKEDGQSTSKHQGGSADGILCYKCGSTEHSLASCPKKGQGKDLPFATCFVCGGKGHIASACPENKKGIYVNGGNCRHCGSQDHLATNCPDKKNKDSEAKDKEEDPHEFDHLLEPQSVKEKKKKKESETEKPKKKKRKVVNF